MRCATQKQLGERLRHLHQVTGLVSLLVGRKGQGSAFPVTQTVIKPGQLGAQVHDGEIHEMAIRGATVLLRGGNQAGSQTAPLVCRIDCEQAEISAPASQFHVNAAGKCARFLGQQELAFLEA